MENEEKTIAVDDDSLAKAVGGAHITDWHIGDCCSMTGVKNNGILMPVSETRPFSYACRVTRVSEAGGILHVCIYCRTETPHRTIVELRGYGTVSVDYAQKIEPPDWLPDL